jgi:E3 ubiquitin-protein ligase MYCBP2
LRGRIVQPRCGFPGCRALPEHPELKEQFAVWSQIRNQIEAQIVQVVEDEALESEPDHVQNPASEYFHDALKFAREKLVFYMCRLCQTPFYGGRVRCEEAEAEQEAEDDKYLCKSCRRGTFARGSCPKHGDAGMIFKCFWCCQPARWFCWGTTHFCDQCHEAPGRAAAGPWPTCDRTCRFHPHPPNGKRQIFGLCSLCEAEKAEADGHDHTE